MSRVHKQMACPHCGKPIEVSRHRMTPERFKELFQVGDIIAGYVTQKHMTITGIGDTRFFYKNTDDSRQKEYMAMQHVYPWTLVTRSGMRPEGQ